MNGTWKSLIMSLGVLVTSLVATLCEAGVIYFDGFTTPGSNRGGSYISSLDGTAPTTDNNGGSNTWIALAESGGWGQTGSGVATPTSSNYLPFVPVQGFTYTLSATIDPSAWGNGEWFTIGFTSTPGNWGPLTGVFNLSEAGLARGGEGSNTYTVVLDTTSPSWTNSLGLAYVGWFTDVPGQANLNPSIVELTIDNFSLTSVAVPEPTALGLLAFGSVLLWFTKGRRGR